MYISANTLSASLVRSCPHRRTLVGNPQIHPREVERKAMVGLKIKPSSTPHDFSTNIELNAKLAYIKWRNMGSQQ